MALSKLDNLYRAVILDHSSNPRHAGELQTGCMVDLNNPTCGDVIRLTVELDGDKISNIAFSGHGCTISTASASMMTVAVLGKTKAQALELAKLFSAMVTGEEDERQEALGDAQFLAGVSKFPARVKCSTLAWNALKKALDEGYAENNLVHGQ
ncbi:Fe-S cluster assembly sulfur transfer protein SufU [Lactococcus taiwanensis]|jgi:nitrogen fixation NifU-like protein|uniref:SUF system NifU family Fe-S cluster assembly protein n=1 Tax=Lactococcus taiwanensis TaxID=1151742 RepID=A0AA45KFM4_9LACT|nr:SUF system NifU family Fe-S cluster assembly protein [Lactococcus taiwanensis]KZK37918.1 putative iron-sulfur cluster assembly scaffold protein for SUF system SufE2 [Lactococcus cremoris]QRZ11115.1 SUF system NifU family Fe-S cluster assembly protein [Lactococcus taiwanensis]QSE76472.1 SUF system NifU family Fe-S cluster assembly protein [Lactococcus taiwanensis]